MRGAFVPPFVKKALDGPAENDTDGPLSAKTLQLLAGDCTKTCHERASICFTRLAWSCLQFLRLHVRVMLTVLWSAIYALIGIILAGPDGELPEALQKLDPRTVEMVCSEILDGRSSVQWDDIAGQDQAKRLVQELVVWPMLNPHLFKASRLPICMEQRSPNFHIQQGL